jgi:hypothetical protein
MSALDTIMQALMPVFWERRERARLRLQQMAARANEPRHAPQPRDRMRANLHNRLQPSHRPELANFYAHTDALRAEQRRMSSTNFRTNWLVRR